MHQNAAYARRALDAGASGFVVKHSAPEELVLPIKKITGLPAFTTVKGGAYFFLPGLQALQYLASLN